MLEKMRKKIIYWGAGDICRKCLEEYSQIRPAFLIDLHLKDRKFCGITIRHPNEISDWENYFIIIAIKSNKAQGEIQNYLNNKGMHNKKDYCSYQEFFGCECPTVEKGICIVNDYMMKHPNMTKAILLVMPVMSISGIMEFFSNYVKQKGNEKHIIFFDLGVASDERMSKKLGCKVFNTPDIYVSNAEDDKVFEYGKQIQNKLSEKEYNWLKELEDRKISDDKERTFFESIGIYYYFKCVIKLIRPSKIVFWGNWTRASYIVGYLADCYRIPCGYMEFGWIPGTYQVDPRGIAGQSEYAVNPQMFEALDVKNIYDIGEIKQFIISNKLDNRTYIDTEDDNIAISRINKERKTIFFVGMGDNGLGINPKSAYWKKYVSNIVESTEEALVMLIKICMKNNWNLVFKPHPGDSVPELGGYLKDVILVRNMEIDRLIEAADVVVSIASAVDYKVLIYGKPLVQLGITGLLGKNCTYIVSGKRMLEKQLYLALEKGMTAKQIENYNRFLQILLQRYLWDNMSDRGLRYGLTVEQDFLS